MARYGKKCRTRNCKYDHSVALRKALRDSSEDFIEEIEVPAKKRRLDQEDRKAISHQQSLTEDDLKSYEIQDLFPDLPFHTILETLRAHNFDKEKCIDDLFSHPEQRDSKKNTNNSSNDNSKHNNIAIADKKEERVVEKKDAIPTNSNITTDTPEENPKPNTSTTTATTTTTTSDIVPMEGLNDKDSLACAICLEEQKVDFMFIMSECSHSFCRDCISGYFKSKIADKVFPIKCPNIGCKKEANENDMEMILDRDMFDKYSENAFRNAIRKNPDMFSCCPTPDCSYIFFHTPADSPDFGCPTCKKRYCLNCRVDYHTGSTCEKYQKWSLENGLSDDLFRDFAQGSKFKQCPGCRHWVEKSEGCDHMTCTCGYEFCYACGGKYGRCECNGEELNSDEEDEEGEYY